MKHFINNNFTGPRCAVVATGIPLSEIAAFANNLEVPSNDTKETASKYSGGEIRKERNSEFANVAIAVEGASLSKESNAVTLAVLQKVLGTGALVKYGNSTSCLQKAITSTAGNEAFAISAFNASYSDSGLMGFVLTAPLSVAGSVIFKSPRISMVD